MALTYWPKQKKKYINKIINDYTNMQKLQILNFIFLEINPKLELINRPPTI